MGKPDNFTEEEVLLLDRVLFPEVSFDHVGGLAGFNVSLPPFGVELIVIKRQLNSEN